MPFKLNNSTFQCTGYWIDAEGSLLELSTMTDSHIDNCIAFMRTKFEVIQKISPSTTQEDIDARICKTVPKFKELLKEREDRNKIKMSNYKPCAISERDW